MSMYHIPSSRRQTATTDVHSQIETTDTKTRAIVHASAVFRRQTLNLLTPESEHTHGNHTSADDLRESLPFPKVISSIVLEYTSDPIIGIYGSRLHNVALTHGRTAVVLDTTEVILDVQKICTTSIMCCILTYNGLLHIIHDHHSIDHDELDRTGSSIFPSVRPFKDILTVGECIIMLKGDGTVVTYDNEGVHTCSITDVLRIQECRSTDDTVDDDTFVAITNGDNGDEIAVVIDSQCIVLEEIRIVGTVDTVYNMDTFTHTTFVVLDGTGGITTSEPYSPELEYYLQHGVVGVSATLSGFVALRENGQVVMWGDVDTIDIPYRLKKVVSTPYRWWGLTEDNNVICWDGHTLSTLNTLANHDLQGAFNDNVTDIYTTYYEVVIVSSSGAFIRVSDQKYPDQPYIRHYNQDITIQWQGSDVYTGPSGQYHIVMVDPQDGRNIVLRFQGGNRMYNSTTKAGHIRHIYTIASTHVALFEDGTVAYWDNLDEDGDSDYNDFMSVVESVLTDIVGIYTIAESRFAAVNSTGEIIIFGYEGLDEVAYKLPPVDELVVAHLTH